MRPPSPTPVILSWMRTPPLERGWLARSAALGAIAAAAAALVVGVAPVRGAADGAPPAGSEWRSVFARPRPQAGAPKRVIVVLSAPSLADRVAAAGRETTAEEQRRWSAEAQAAQELLLVRLRHRG